MIRLKIKKDSETTILFEAISKIDHFGFGTFLCNIQPEEIECDEFSKKAILYSHEKSGLNGVEIWEDNRIAWGSPAEKIIMPIRGISKMNGAEKWIEKIPIV